MNLRPILNVPEILALPLFEFESLFGFRPAEPIEKFYFAETGLRMDKFAWLMYRAGLMVEPDYGKVVME